MKKSNLTMLRRMTMSDSEKIDLIRTMIADFWECSNISEDGAICILNAVTCVVNFKGKENKNAEN